jgi:prolyl 4-hydroxylase
MTYTEAVFQLSVDCGFALTIAHRVVEEALAEHDDQNVNRCFNAPNEGSASPDIRSSGTTIDLGDCKAEVAFEQLAPRIVLLDHFLSHDECDRLCGAAAPFTPSGVLLNGVISQFDDMRNSHSASIYPTADIVSVIEHRISRLTNWPISHGEAIQIQRYGANQQFVPHYDFFMQGSTHYNRQMDDGGQRIATLIMYLKTPEKGGATHLVNLGQRIMPRKGSALFFTYPEPTPQSGTLHAGEPVIAGEKWIATKWFRLRATSLSPWISTTQSMAT